MSAKSADLVVHNANVITMDPRRPRAELVAVEGGEIVWVGSNSDLDLFASRTKLLNCGGKTLVPGFNDAHAHILSYVSRLLGIDCGPEAVGSISGIRDAIRRRAAQVPPGTWLKGHGYNEFYLAERRHPNRHDLDQAAPDHPVKLTHRSLHACVLNSLALSLAGISRETPDPPGGLIDRELETGEPSGILFGMNAQINEQVVPPLSDGELRQGAKLASERFLSAGVTTVQDATARNGFEQWRAFRALKEEGLFLPRVRMMFGHHALAALLDRGMSHGCGDSGLRLGAVKIALDEAGGRLNPSQEELNQAVLSAHEAGFQVAIHAVEEGTVAAASGALEYCLDHSPRPDHRHRVEHCSVCPPALLERLREVDALVVTQPAFIYYSGERYLAEVPRSQLPWLYRMKSFLEHGLGPVGSSDCPVVPSEPLVGIYAAVTRRAQSGQTLSIDESVLPNEALMMFTLSGAYGSFEEDGKGSIAVGKLADMVVLSADPTAVPSEEIKEIRVEMTILGGEPMWER